MVKLKRSKNLRIFPDKKYFLPCGKEFRILKLFLWRKIFYLFLNVYSKKADFYIINYHSFILTLISFDTDLLSWWQSPFFFYGFYCLFFLNFILHFIFPYLNNTINHLITIIFVWLKYILFQKLRYRIERNS